MNISGRQLLQIPTYKLLHNTHLYFSIGAMWGLYDSIIIGLMKATFKSQSHGSRLVQ